MTRPVGRSIHDRRFSPLRLRIRHTVDAGSPVRAPRYTGPRRVLRRSRHTRSSSLVGAHNSVVGADKGFRAPSGDRESVRDSIHEDSASARIAAGQRPRPSFRHPQGWPPVSLAPSPCRSPRHRRWQTLAGRARAARTVGLTRLMGVPTLILVPSGFGGIAALSAFCAWAFGVPRECARCGATPTERRLAARGIDLGERSFRG